MKNKQLLLLLSLSLTLLMAAWGTLGWGQRAQAAAPQVNHGCRLLSSTCTELNPAAYPQPLRIQATTSLTPSKDNTLYEDNEGDLSNGAGSSLFAGRTNQGNGSIRRGLLFFDLANSGIPTNSLIISATLRLNVSQSNSDSETVTLNRLLADWGQGTSVAGGSGGQGVAATIGDATWLHTFFNTSFWATPGGDFASTTSASKAVGDVGVYTWSDSRMAGDLQSWLNNPATNFGWIIRGNESITGTAKRFDSRENTTAANQPTLIIEYVPIVDTVYLPIIQR